jgi:hypothetical protein
MDPESLNSVNEEEFEFEIIKSEGSEEAVEKIEVVQVNDNGEIQITVNPVYDNNGFLIIDGSQGKINLSSLYSFVGEGGGQIVRMALTFACILQKPVHLVNIRANRNNPGM